MENKNSDVLYGEDVFLPALATEEDTIEYLAHACRSLERHHWKKVDNITLPEEGYRLIQACASDATVMKKCIRALGIALQIKDYYGYKFTHKSIYDELVRQHFVYIIPKQPVSLGAPGLRMCENALYVCRLFEKISQDGLHNGQFREAFIQQLAAVLPEQKNNEHASIAQRIRALYHDIQLLPLEIFPINDSDSEENLTDREFSSNDSNHDNRSISSLSTLSEVAPSLVLIDDENTLENLMSAYRQYEINGKLGSSRDVQGKLLIEACLNDPEILLHCLQATEHALQYMEKHHYHFKKAYYPGLGNVYRLNNTPDLTFSMGEHALYALDLFKQLYQHGYQDALTQAAFQANMKAVLDNPNLADQLPNIGAAFRNIMNGPSLNTDNISSPMTERQEEQETIDKIKTVLAYTTQDMRGRQASKYLMLIIPFVLMMVSLIVKYINPTANDKLYIKSADDHVQQKPELFKLKP